VSSDPRDRPRSVPPDAVFDESSTLWNLGTFDEKGLPTGDHASYRSDGSLVTTCHYENGVLEGLYRRFHPNGELARECTYKDGKLDGKLEAFTSRDPTNEALRGCCVPPGAARLEGLYRDGAHVFERFFDADGRRILQDGSPYPEKPNHLPDEARLDEWSKRWYTGGFSSDDTQAMLRFWSTAGALAEERQTVSGKLHGVLRYYAPSGDIEEESHYEKDVRTGSYRRLVKDRGIYADGRIREERGAYLGELARGRWEFLDDDGQVIFTAELGEPDVDVGRSPAFETRALSRESWRERAGELVRTHRLGEALVALARGAGPGDADWLRRAMDAWRPRMTDQEANRFAAEAIEKADGKIDRLVNALARGAEPAAMLRSIAASCPRATRASLDLVNAAVLLAPEWDQCRVTRALVRLSIGDPTGASEDADQLGDSYAEQRQFLRDYARLLFPRFDFWPARVEFDSLVADLPEEPCQPLSKIRRAIQKSATRIAQMHGAIVEQLGGELRWAMPNVSSLLPNGPVPLEKRTFNVVLEDEDQVPEDATEGVEQVSLDETLDLTGRDVASIMRAVRSEYNVLTWLCWSAGLDKVALPDRLAPPPNFNQAVGMAIERQWRAWDKLTTGGIMALSKGVRAFEWEGLDIDFISPALVELVAQEYTDLRAVFFFLCDDRQESPWQDNLRRA
jgi:antitoxin component YwqK of YwqJK toxin-antitoxin module